MSRSSSTRMSRRAAGTSFPERTRCQIGTSRTSEAQPRRFVDRTRMLAILSPHTPRCAVYNGYLRVVLPKTCRATVLTDAVQRRGTHRWRWVREMARRTRRI